MKSLKIGKIKLKNKLILAPMFGITNLPFRLLCRSQGAALCFTEMLHTSQILHQKNIPELKTAKEDSPLGVQLVGSSVGEFRKCIPKLKKFGIIDINFGCPSARISDDKAGAYLLKNPKKISEIISLLKEAKLTVTAKIRLGFEKNNALKIAKVAQKAGADAITVHARLATNSYKIPADWNEIKKIKSQIKIPVIGNGDIFSGKDAEQMLKIADGAMIARAAIGNPQIFSQILTYLKTKKEIQISPEERIKQFQKYLILCKNHSETDIAKIKCLGAHFIKGVPGAAKLRNEFMQLKTFKEIENFAKELF